MKAFLQTLIILGAILQCQAREEIITMSLGLKASQITTGNGNTQLINYEKLHSSSQSMTPFSLDKRISDTFENLKKIKDNLIVDFSNEDPKVFRPDTADYPYVASKRGYIFNLAAIVLLALLFWIFIIRIAYGDCGGYKTIIRKPTKTDRVKTYIKVTIGSCVFLTAFVVANVMIYKDRQISKDNGIKLVKNNEKQLSRAQSALRRIGELNKQNLDVIYSSLSYERLRVGTFLKPIISSYNYWIQKAQSFNNDFFEGTKNHMYVRILFIFITVSVALLSFVYSYKSRSLTKSLMLSAILGGLALFTLNTMNTQFNHWSIFLEVCEQTIQVIDKRYGDITYNYEMPLNELMNCLSPEETQNMKRQLVSLLIAQNTALTVLRNFFKIENLSIVVNGYLSSVTSVINNFAKLEEQLDTIGGQSSVPVDHLKNILKASLKISEIYNDLEHLDYCYEMRDWSNYYNNSMCRDGIRYQYYTIFALFGMFVGIAVLAIALFSAENVIRGLYNEEIQYVKTNKLRYDWN